MMKKLYFDTNVFDHIHKGIGITEAERVILRSAVHAGKISILLSYLNMEEALSALKSCPDTGIAEIRLILDLANWQRPIKKAKILLSDDMRCYAQGKVLSEPFITLSPEIESNLRELLNPNQQDVRARMLQVNREIQQQKEGFKSGMGVIRNKWLMNVKKFKGKRPSFEEFWERYAEDLTECFAERAGVLDACKKRSINGLLRVRSVRLCVGVNLSLIYAQHFEGRTPDMGDSRDIHHAILASAADTFVTQDRKFAGLLTRIPIEKFEIMNLRDLITVVR
jgi:hypothetical protein